MSTATAAHRPIVVANTKDMPREEWLALRKQGLGGSDAAAAAGLDRWRSKYALWVEKTTNLLDDEAGEAALWGTLLEDVVAREFGRRTDLVIRRDHALWRHPDLPFMLSNLDRRITTDKRGPGLLECKSTSLWREHEWTDGELPDAAALQVQHYFAVSGLQWGYVAVLIGGQRLEIIEVERDDQLIDDLIAIESDFWRYVETGEQPPTDGHESTAEALLALHANALDEEVELAADAAAPVIREYHAAKEAEAEAKARKAAAANALRAMVGDFKHGLVDGKKAVTWSRYDSNKLDVKALRAAHPDICAEFTAPTPSQRLTVKEIDAA